MSGWLLWLALAQAGDISTTAVALNRGCVEANPVLSKLPASAIGGIKAGVTVTLTVHFGRKEKLSGGDKALIGAFAGAGTVASMLNIKQLPRCSGGR